MPLGIRRGFRHQIVTPLDKQGTMTAARNNDSGTSTKGSQAMKCEKCGNEVDPATGFCETCMSMVAGAESSTDSPAEAASGGTEPQGPEENATTASQQASQDAAPKPKAPSRSDPDVELWTGRYSSKAMIGTWILLGLLTLVFIVAGFWMIQKEWIPGTFITWVILLAIPLLLWIYFGCVYLWRRWTIRYRLTTYRFYSEKGLLRHTVDTLEVIDINDMKLSRTLWERILGIGTIILMSNDASDPELHVVGIDNPKEAFDKIDTARREEHIRRGLKLQ
ncbi:MAG: hypothetical protein D6741_00065 [Planctomycetota bacterium]|nr:MAG: hypothetical protein D6741_00065 [Planctomycetota bacterium]